MTKPKPAYSFKEGLAMMAAKDVGIDPYLAADAGEDARTVLAALRRAKTAKGSDKAKHIATAQTELRKLNPQQHGKLITALQAKVLALQGRGGDTAVAHLEPGEMVIPRAVLTPELAQLIASEAAKRGLDPKQLIVGNRRASVNPATGAEEFGFWGHLLGNDDELDMTGVGPVTTIRRVPSLPSTGNDDDFSAAVIGGSMFIGDQLDRSAPVRDNYNARIAHLENNLPDKRMREDIRFDERAKTPVLARGILDRLYPLTRRTDEQLADLGSPSKTDPSVNRAAKAFKVLGPAGMAISAGLGAEQIANADNKVREAFGVGGSMLGGVAGGIGGASAGTVIAPGVGTLIGGAGGSIAGSLYGEQRGYDLYDGIGRKFSRRGP